MLITILVFVAILSVLVLVHELGHFIAAKKSGIWVQEFGFGYPPKVWSKKLGETIYSINLLPFGGFVKLYGEEGPESSGQKPKLVKINIARAFFSQSKIKRSFVLLSGVLANILLGLIAFSIVYSVAGVPRKVDYIRVVGIAPNSPAEASGLKNDDQIQAVGLRNEDKGEDIYTSFVSTSEFTEFVKKHSGENILLKVKRGQKPMVFKIFVRPNPPENEGALGIIITDTIMYHYPWWQVPFVSAVEGVKEAASWSLIILSSFALMIKQLVLSGKFPQDVAGPVGLLQATRTVSQAGWLAIVQFTGVISINLAILNVLPFPALDGGRLVFVLLEGVIGRKIKPQAERLIHTVGMVILLGLMAAVTANDFARILNTTAVGQRLKSFWPF